MARFLLVNTATNLVENAIELDPTNYTTTFILNDRGTQLPTFIDTDGVAKVSTTKYLIPTGYTIYQSDSGDIGDAWPLVSPTTNNSGE